MNYDNLVNTLIYLQTILLAIYFINPSCNIIAHPVIKNTTPTFCHILFAYFHKIQSFKNIG